MSLDDKRLIRRDWLYWTFVASLAVSFSLWLIPIGSPLWLDEAISFCQIHLGRSQITSQPRLTFPAYSYILWFLSRFLGTSEIALRIPSVLAMLGAVYLLYRATLALFDSTVALISVILFCLNPIVVFAAIDARPYAFGALAINASIYVLVCLRESNSIRLAVGLGIFSAMMLWFHFLFGVMVPALLAGFVVVKLGVTTDSSPEIRRLRRKVMWRQLTAAISGFILFFLPIIPGLLYMFRTKGDHPFDRAPELGDLIFTIAPGWTLPMLAVTAFLGLIIAGLRTEKSRTPGAKVGLWRILLSQILALVPLLILYIVSISTSLHIFVMRYRLVGSAGICICWALLVSGFKPRVLQAVFCLGMVAITTVLYLRSPAAHQHGYTWKYAIEVAEKNTATQHSPVLICSDLPEADHWPMPTGDAVKDSNLFAPLSYYKLSAPVVALPRSLNPAAMTIGSNFIQAEAARHERFLAMAYIPSYPTLQWLIKAASATHNAHQLGEYDGVSVVEFTPRAN